MNSNFIHSFIHSFHWHVLNAPIPCCSQELLPFLSVMYFFLPPFSTNYSSILSHLILSSISWSTSQSCCSQIHVRDLSKRFEHLLLWPPRSPDLTPCDFFIWGYVKDNAYKPPLPQNVRELQDRIRAAVQTIDGNKLVSS